MDLILFLNFKLHSQYFLSQHFYIYIYIYIYNQVVLRARWSLSLSLSLTLSLSPFIPIGLIFWLVFKDAFRYMYVFGEHWCVHVVEFIIELRLGVHSFSSAPHILFILLGWFLKWKTGGCTVAVFWVADSWSCSRQHAAFLHCSHLAFSHGVLLTSVWCILQLGRNKISTRFNIK